jgi:hypothetical protein
MERLLVGDSEGGSRVLVATVARAVPHVFQQVNGTTAGR